MTQKRIADFYRLAPEYIDEVCPLQIELLVSTGQLKRVLHTTTKNYGLCG